MAGSRFGTSLKLTTRQLEFLFRARREHGDVFRFPTLIHDELVTMVNHHDHVKSLMSAKPTLAPSVTGESPLRPIVGPNSTLTALGARHMRQRKLLLPSFHGEAVARYAAMITEAAEREVDGWTPGQEVELAPRMQAVTLDVIMAGIFGVEGKPERGTPEYDLRRVVRVLADLSTKPIGQIGEFMNAGRDEPVGITKIAMARLDKPVYEVIRQRRADPASAERDDILSLLLRAETEDGELLTDHELRDELLTLVLAGHETTANQLAWTFERLVRTPDAWARLREEAPRGRRLRRRDHLRVPAQPARDPDGRPPRHGPVALRRRRRPRRQRLPDEHRAAAPPRGPVPRPVRLPSRALRRHQARHLHVDPVRRRHPALPRRRARARRDAHRRSPRSPAAATCAPRHPSPRRPSTATSR